MTLERPIENDSSVAPVPKQQTHELAEALDAKVISGLDVIRALAISLVLIQHFGVVGLPTGAMGVMIFFVLSGFLITRMLLREYRSSANISFSRFYSRRALRIFPMFYVCWLVNGVLLALHHKFHPGSALVSFFYLMDYGRALSPPSQQVELNMWISWSLAIEEKFYLLWPLLLLFLLRRRSGLIRNISLIILGQWIYRAVLRLAFGVSWTYLYQAFDARFDALLVGCLLAVVLEREDTARHLQWALRSQWLTLVPVAMLISMLFVRSGSEPLNLFLTSVQPVIVAILLSQVVYWTYKSWWPMRGPAVAFLAHISYALYLWHAVLEDEFIRRHPDHTRTKAAIITLIVATASHFLIEKPFMRLRDVRWRRSKARVLQAGTVPL